MRLWILALILTASVSAQHRGGFGGGGRGGFGGGGFSRGGGIVRGGGYSHGGFSGGFNRGGGIIRGGGFSHGGFSSGFSRGGGYIRPGYSYGGFRGFGYYGRGYRSGFGFGLGLGYGYPFYSSYWGYSPYYSPYAYDWYGAPPVYSAPPVVVIGSDDEDRSYSRAPVVINNGPVRDWRERDFSAEPRAHRWEQRDESGPITYLVALTDGRIWAAVAYWTEGNTLHIVTRQKERMDLALDQVDRPYSERLNRERGVQFRLP